ncbi:hypothetical protein [Pseudoalteromonas piscicida]|uniref:Uncharacterized protein n=1 Tax=Pseudoalteromonas piscicida TaxID=43662 RepID=A0A2A5JMD0_PSEO7|nr:hypothetical protein [Pseudoalteromonas piscicida]PCK30588.1 hypothetical protein CEX98_16570 [Pseudoalteromonas piscicida]
MSNKIRELWSLRLNPSDFRNIERVEGDNPKSGNGQLYIQIPKGLVTDLLTFIRKDYPENGMVHSLEVYDIKSPESEPEVLEFRSKSMGRMRTSKQNRHRNTRLSAWLPKRGFPTLEPFASIEDAQRVLEEYGCVHLFLARLESSKVFVGFTKGQPPTKSDASQPFSDLLWGESKGGYWSSGS